MRRDGRCLTVSRSSHGGVMTSEKMNTGGGGVGIRRPSLISKLRMKIITMLIKMIIIRTDNNINLC